MARSRSLAVPGIVILTAPGVVSDDGFSSDLLWRPPRSSVNVFIYPFVYLFTLYIYMHPLSYTSLLANVLCFTYDYE